MDGRRDPSGGWGYNATVPPDADSTIWAVQLAERVAGGASASLGAARAFLERHRRPGGGLATYADAAPVRADMGFPAWVSYRGWTSAHPCVTAAASNVRLLGDQPDELDAYLRRTQRSDGSWPAYWWADREYATALAVLGLAGRRPGPGPAHAQGGREATHPPPSTAPWAGCEPGWWRCWTAGRSSTVRRPSGSPGASGASP